MQNEDEDLDGLEQKLSHLKPRQLDEPFLAHLSRTLHSEAGVDSGDLERQPLQQAAYPANVVWMRFAPVAAAAGVVLLGTFFMHYQSSMNGNLGAVVEVGAPSIPSSVTAKVESFTAVVAPAVQAGSSLAQGASNLPVPHLGLQGDDGALHSLDSSLIPVSGQDYLRPLGREMGFNQSLQNSSAALHFAEAYHWQEESKMKQNTTTTGQE